MSTTRRGSGSWLHYRGGGSACIYIAGPESRTQGGKGARFMGLVHHTDGEREWAYDRQSRIGKLDKALDAASANSWTVVDMKRDWHKVFAFQ
jgi:hypothetical protein